MADRRQAPDVPGSGGADLESTASLLARIRDGDTAARDLLLRRFLPALKRWARGRLPRQARDLAETDDLVQETFLKALDHLKEFEPRGQGSFLAYLRRILLNHMKDVIRASKRRPGKEPLGADLPADCPSPLEEVIGRENLERYEAALATLPEKQQDAVILRIELGFTHEEVAALLECHSANAARMMVARALLQLSEVMK